MTATRTALLSLAWLLATGDARADTPDFDIAVSLHGGAGYAAMDAFDRGVRDYVTALETQVPMYSAGAPVSHRLLAIGLRAQWRGPRRIIAELGVDLLDNRASTTDAIGSVTGTLRYRNRSLALPLLLGAHLPISDRLAATAALGPVLLLANRSEWRDTLRDVSSFDNRLGAGLEIDAGLEVVLVWKLRAVFSGRYRFAESGLLEVDGVELEPLQPIRELGWSGVAADIGLRVVFD